MFQSKNSDFYIHNQIWCVCTTQWARISSSLFLNIRVILTLHKLSGAAEKKKQRLISNNLQLILFVLTTCVIAFTFCYVPFGPTIQLAIHRTVYVAPFFFRTWFNHIHTKTKMNKIIYYSVFSQFKIKKE